MAANRAMAIWASAERRARVYGFMLLVSMGVTGLALLNTYKAWHREREVVRVGCDGIPQLVRVNDEVYAEADERELRAFVGEFTVFFMRYDSHSILNDSAWAAARMTPELAEAFKATMRGGRDRPGVIPMIEGLQRRTQIDPGRLEITIDKSRYPWTASVKGERQIVGQDETEKFSLALDLLRASRNEVIAGVVVAGVRPSDPGLGATAAATKRVSMETEAK